MKRELHRVTLTLHHYDVIVNTGTGLGPIQDIETSLIADVSNLNRNIKGFYKSTKVWRGERVRERENNDGICLQRTLKIQ